MSMIFLLRNYLLLDLDFEEQEELYKKTIEENEFSESNIHGIGDEENADN